MATNNKIYLSAFFACISSNAMALDPAALDFEGAEITPTLGLAGTYDSNYSTSNVSQSSWITSITPAVSVIFFGDKSEYELEYVLNHQIYEAKEAQSLTNQYFQASANFDIDIQNQLAINSGITKTENAANTFTLGTLNAFTETSIGAGYTYGAPNATGNIELGLNRITYRSDNSANGLYEYDSNQLNAAFIYKVTDKTKLTAEIEAADFDYVINDGLDGQNIAYLLGARWESTAKTTGYAKIGTQTKNFDQAGKDSRDITNWELSVDWAPKTYSVVTLKTNQKIVEGTYAADYTDYINNSISWKHDWGRGYTSKLNFNNFEKDYSSGRLDSTYAYGLGIKYEAKRWMDISLDYQHSNQDSTDLNYDYDRDIIQLTVDLSL